MSFVSGYGNSVFAGTHTFLESLPAMVFFKQIVRFPPVWSACLSAAFNFTLYCTVTLICYSSWPELIILSSAEILCNFVEILCNFVELVLKITSNRRPAISLME